MMLEQPKYSQLLPRPAWDGRDSQRGVSDSVPIIDFGYVFKVVRRRFKLILTFIVLAVLAGVVIVLTSPPVYNSTAKIIIEKRTIDPLQQESVFAATSLNTAEADGQLQVIAADDLIRRVIQKLNLLAEPKFVEPPKNIFDTAGEELSNFAAQFGWSPDLIAWLRGDTEAIGEAGLLQAAVEKIKRNLRVSRIGLSYVMNVTVTWTSPSIAARIANAIVETYIADRLGQRSKDAEAASAWFDGRLAELKAKADDAESAVAAFRVENNIVEAGREGLLNEQQLSAVSSELASATTAAQNAQDQLMRIALISAADIASAPIGGSPDENILGNLRAELLDLKQQEKDAIATHGADHSISVDLRNQLTQLSERIDSELTRLRGIFQGNYDLAKAHETGLKNRLLDLTSQSAAVGGALVKLKALESEASVYRSLYDSYLQRYLQTLQQQSLPTADARIISAAVPPENRENMGGRTIVAIAVAIGASLGLGAAFFRERMDRSIRTSWQLRLVTGAPTLGLLPARAGKQNDKAALRVVAQSDLSSGEVSNFRQMHISDRRYATVLSEPFSRFTETIRRVRVAVDSAGHSKPCSIVGFLSNDARETKGIVASNYAQLLSSSGHKTLLIDLDFRNLNLTRALTPQTPVGLIDISAPGAAVRADTAVWKDDASQMHFLPARGLANDEKSTGVVSSDRLIRILVQLAANYEFIILDLPSLAVSSDAAALANAVAGYILVAEWGKTSGDMLAEHISQSGVPLEKLLGTVLSDVDLVQYRKYERLD